jgi:tripartite-type tricarboxylate transporter receptor subunit TctC
MRRNLTALLFLLFAQLAAPVWADEYPTRPVTLIVAGAAGLPIDILSRTLAPAMGAALGQPVVVDNRLGAGSLVGYEYAARRPADGYTIAMVSVVQLASLPATVKTLRFDPLKGLPPFIGIGEGKVMLVATRSNVPWNNFKDMVSWFKAHPGTLNFGVSAPNTVLLAHALMRDLELQGKVVPYSNAGPLVTDLVAGVHHMAWIGETAVPAVAARAQVLATSGAQRSPKFPDVPTFAELGLSQIPGLGYSVNAPAGTPPEALAKLTRAVQHALEQPEVKARLQLMQLEITNTSAEVARRELQQQAALFSEIGMRVGYAPQ